MLYRQVFHSCVRLFGSLLAEKSLRMYLKAVFCILVLKKLDISKLLIWFSFFLCWISLVIQVFCIYLQRYLGIPLRVWAEEAVYGIRMIISWIWLETEEKSCGSITKNVFIQRWHFRNSVILMTKGMKEFNGYYNPAFLSTSPN